MWIQPIKIDLFYGSVGLGEAGTPLLWDEDWGVGAVEQPLVAVEPRDIT